MTTQCEIVEAAMFGSLEVPVDHRMTVEVEFGSTGLVRYFFGYSIVVVTGGPAVPDLAQAAADTFARYRQAAGEWVSDADPTERASVRRYVREFTWTSEYTKMFSVIACLSDDDRSMIVHGSCTVLAGHDEMERLRTVVASAKLAARID